MSSTLLPFLYQTRTLQRARKLSVAAVLARRLHNRNERPAPRPDNSIPFEWDHNGPRQSLVGATQSTITPPEAKIFKNIFDEISQGKMPSPRERPTATSSSTDVADPETEEFDPITGSADEPYIKARSIVEQARVTGFRDKFLQRSPESLRSAAQIALGLYELDPGSSQATPGASHMLELDEADKAKWAVRAWYDKVRSTERARVEALMQRCSTDIALWKVLEKEVFTLPEKLGIYQPPLEETASKGTAKGKEGETKKPKIKNVAATVAARAGAEEEKHVMDVHGPLYPHYISAALTLFDTAFVRPSPYGFRILPRVKELGLPSYVLGVSVPFYSRLAQMHWDRYGDANSALDVVQEMTSAGLYAPGEVAALLSRIRDHLHGCTWGAQGPFVEAMMEAPPYDGALMERLDEVARLSRRAFMESEGEYQA